MFFPNAKLGRTALALIALPCSTFAQELDPVTCLIEPQEVIELATPVSGLVAEVSVDRGDLVRAGDTIARLDSSAERVALELAELTVADGSGLAAREAQAEFLDSEAERKKRLAERRAIPAGDARAAEIDAVMGRREVDVARLENSRAALEVERARLALAQRDLTSPVDGIVTERLLSVGEYWNGQSHIATIAKLDELRVEAFVPIDYYDALSVGQTVSILPEPPLDTPRQGEIDVIDRVFDAATGTVGIRILLDNSDLSLPAGLRCQVLFETG